MIKPEIFSGRTPKEIVSDSESTWLKPYLVETDAPELFESEHLLGCHCQSRCFQKKLDALIALQEVSLESLNNGGHNAY